MMCFIREICLFVALCVATVAIGQNPASKCSTEVDTLLNVKSAGAITVVSNSEMTNIHVTCVAGSDDNFHYRVSNKNSKKHNSAYSYIKCKDVTSIVVAETASDVSVEFVDENGKYFEYSFAFVDPDNRAIKSYLGGWDSDLGVTISHKNELKWEVVSQGLAYGWSTTIDANPEMDIDMGKSHELTWNMIVGLRMVRGHHSLSVGFGIHKQNFVTVGKNYFQKNDDGTITLTPFDSEMTKGESSLRLFSMQIPLIYKCTIGSNHDWGVSFGPVLNFNSGGHIETKYTLRNSDYKINTGDIGQKSVTVDGMAMINYKSVGLYARYSPMNRFEERTGLDFKTFSTGVMLCF